MSPLPKALPPKPPPASPPPKPTLRTRLSSLLPQLSPVVQNTARALRTSLTSRATYRLTGRLTLLFVSLYASAALVRTYLLDYSGNRGLSMLPTVPAHHALSVMSPWFRHGRGVKIGDIVQAHNPIMKGQLIGKRVVGLPGDYVLRDEHLATTVGGAEAVAGGLGGVKAEGERKEPVMIQVPEGHVWLAGDNMSWSRDSRFFGPVPLALIKAKTLWHVTGFFTWERVWMEQVKKVEDAEQV